jgi:hypothetical protein
MMSRWTVCKHSASTLGKSAKGNAHNVEAEEKKEGSPCTLLTEALSEGSVVAMEAVAPTIDTVHVDPSC